MQLDNHSCPIVDIAQRSRWRTGQQGERPWYNVNLKKWNTKHQKHITCVISDNQSNIESQSETWFTLWLIENRITVSGIHQTHTFIPMKGLLLTWPRIINTWTRRVARDWPVANQHNSATIADDNNLTSAKAQDEEDETKTWGWWNFKAHSKAKMGSEFIYVMCCFAICRVLRRSWRQRDAMVMKNRYSYRRASVAAGAGRLEEELAGQPHTPDGDEWDGGIRWEQNGIFILEVTDVRSSTPAGWTGVQEKRRRQWVRWKHTIISKGEFERKRKMQKNNEEKIGWCKWENKYMLISDMHACHVRIDKIVPSPRWADCRNHHPRHHPRPRHLHHHRPVCCLGRTCIESHSSRTWADSGGHCGASRW